MTASHQFHPFARDARRKISSDMLSFLRELKPLLLSGFGAEIPGSRADRLGKIYDEDCSQGPYPGRNAMETALFATLAGVDHAQLVAVAIADEELSFSVATAARGTLESFGRAWWLIEPEADRDMMARWLSGLSAEISMYMNVNPGAKLDELRGRHADPEEAHAAVLDDLERLTGSRKPESARPTALTTGLVNRIGTNGRYQYSHLSGVAHGESMGHHGFVDLNDALGTYDVGLDERWGVSYARQAFSAASFLGKQMLMLLGRPVLPGHPCAVAHDAAAATIWAERARAFRG